MLTDCCVHTYRFDDQKKQIYLILGVHEYRFLSHHGHSYAYSQ